MAQPATPGRFNAWLNNSRQHLALAWPLCLGHVGQQGMAMVDAAMVGHYSPVALAGLGIAGALLFAITFFGVGVILGLDSVIPQAMGRGDEDEARTLYRSGLRLALAIGIPLTLLGAASPFLLGVFGVQSQIAEEATQYVYGRLPSLIPYLLFTANISYLQASGKTRPIIWVVVIGNAINLVADSLLVFGDQTLVYLHLPAIGLPSLGSLGAAVSSSIVTIVMAAYLGYATYCIKRPHAKPATPDRIRKILRIGFPIGLQLVAEVGIFAIVGMLTGRLGEVPSAAHLVAITLASVTFSVALGMGAATSVRVGNAIGRGSHQDARSAGIVGVFWSASIMLLAGTFFLTIPVPLASLFTSDAAVVSACVPLLAIAAVFQLSDATQAVLSGALRGAGDTRAALIGNVIGHYGLGIWVALGLGFGAGMGAVGLWWGLSAGLSLTAIGLAVRFWQLTSNPIALS